VRRFRRPSFTRLVWILAFVFALSYVFVLVAGR
jgi:hypothetical protein